MEPLPEPALPAAPRTYGGNAAFHNFFNDYSHITDPNLRRRLALSEVDKIPFGWYHIRAVVVAGIGFFTDSYDIFAINLITAMLGMVYFQGEPILNGNLGGNFGVLPTSVDTALKAATSGGAVIGQLLFGWLADKMGRRKMYGVELVIIVLSTLVQSLAGPSWAVSMTGLLIFWRVVMGIGIGGDYPLSAVITSEFAPTRWRGAMMAAVFSMQGAGQFAAALVALIVTIGFRDSFVHTAKFLNCTDACQVAGDRSWRIIVAFGAVPACFALYYRITIPETPRYTFDIALDIEKGDADIKAYIQNKAEGVVDPVTQQKTKQRIGKKLSTPQASWSDVISYFSQWKNFKVLFATSSSWFFLDLAFYGLSLNNVSVLNAIGFSGGANVYEVLRNNAIGNLVLVCAGSIPGYWTTVFLVDTLGRKTIQIGGFFILTIIFCIIGFTYHLLSKAALLTLYIFAQFFFNFGPNSTTFIVPGECFPTRYRSTGHGISAAWGKVGAIIAQVITSPLLSKGAPPGCEGDACHPWLNHLMKIFALFMLCGTVVSFLLPETKGSTLEELAGEEPENPNEPQPMKKRGLRKYNPFGGGKPSGLNWKRSPNVGPRGPGLLGKRERTGIMSPVMSPEMVALKAEKPSFRDSRDTSQESNGGTPGYSMSVSSRGRQPQVGDADTSDDLYINGVGAGQLPGWGAGWGVQKNNPNRDGRTNSIQLLDVGKLLK